MNMESIVYSNTTTSSMFLFYLYSTLSMLALLEKVKGTYDDT